MNDHTRLQRQLVERVAKDIDDNGRPEIYYREISLVNIDAIPLKLEACGRTFELWYVNMMMRRATYALQLDEDEEIPKARK